MAPNGYLIDTNLLLLYVVGLENPDIIAKHRRLQDYSVEDYSILIDLLRRVDRLVVTPNTLTETSNLLDQHGDPERTRLFERLRDIIQDSNEVTVTSAEASYNPVFVKLGLADAVLWEIASAETPLVTVDFPLWLKLIERGDEDVVINFNNLRDF